LSNTTGSGNTAIGDDALNNLTTGMRNIALGLGAGGSLTTGSDNIDIGNPGVADDFPSHRLWRGGRVCEFGRAAWHEDLFCALQRCNPANGQRKPSDTFAQTSHIPLQKGARPSRHTAVWPCCRGCGKSES